MSEIKDIRPHKQKLRKKYKSIRHNMTQDVKKRLDIKIYNKLIGMWAYRESEQVLTYVSKEIEVDTIKLIEHTLQINKPIAVPRCVDGSRKMEFYYINSFEDLEKGSFGVLEPIVSRCKKVEDFSYGLCLVPALAFDKKGYRLGYGKGYYDRFLSNFNGETLGLCYSECIFDSFFHGRYDKAVDLLITENDIIRPNDSF